MDRVKLSLGNENEVNATLITKFSFENALAKVKNGMLKVMR